jgi:hypothetical protein
MAALPGLRQIPGARQQHGDFQGLRLRANHCRGRQINASSDSACKHLASAQHLTVNGRRHDDSPGRSSVLSTPSQDEGLPRGGFQALLAVYHAIVSGGSKAALETRCVSAPCSSAASGTALQL